MDPFLRVIIAPIKGGGLGLWLLSFILHPNDGLSWRTVRAIARIRAVPHPRHGVRKLGSERAGMTGTHVIVRE